MRRRQAEMKRAREAGQLDKERRELDQREIQALETYRMNLSKGGYHRRRCCHGGSKGMVCRRGGAAADAGGGDVGTVRQCSASWSRPRPGPELVIFVTEVTAGYDASWFVENFGCDAYFPQTGSCF